jgi:O-succinylbenzoate synthase
MFWSNLHVRFGVRRAFDRAKGRSVNIAVRSSEVLIYKSAVDPALEYSSLVSASSLPISYTSYLDHPVGQAFATYSAAANIIGATTVETCGLLTHDVYEPNAFSERLKTNGPVLIPPEGTGIGFDDLLENLPWVELK